MNNKSLKFLLIILSLTIIFKCITLFGKDDNHDEWHNFDGTPIVCRYNGCGKKPLYSNWEDRFCAEHIDRSANHKNQYNSSTAKKKINTKKALTKEEADKLRGTGYHGTRPNSTAESIEIDAAMVKCKKCGMHSDNGSNSLCDECQYNKDYGLD